VSTAAPLGPDAIVLRIPLDGGMARAYRYPALDSVIWVTRTALPKQAHPLAFSIDDGTLAMTDGPGVPWRLTLGSGQLERALPTPLADAASLDGAGVFGVRNGSVLRLTASDAVPWEIHADVPPSQLQPLRDGGVLLIAHRRGETLVRRYRPPGTTATDSISLAGTARLVSAAGGDRYYLSDGPRSLVSVRARDLEKLGSINVGDSIITTATTPSGDRVYVLGRDDDEARVQVINKFTDEIVARLDVPGDASALRMDPLGRYLMVRHGGASDSVLVVAIATNAIAGRFTSSWRSDLPTVFPDGRLATLRGEDVVVLSAGDFRASDVIVQGARDVWTVVQWNGFRRRAGDAPMRASASRADTAPRGQADSSRTAVAATDSAPRRGDAIAQRADTMARQTARLDSSVARRDTGAARRLSTADSVRRARALKVDSSRRVAARADSQPRATRPQAPATAPAAPASLGEKGAFVVQFAALKAEGPAQQLANSIRANGERARVVVTTTNGIALYRVILGPYRTRPDAERAGQAAGRDYWVYEGGSN
jgi:cell division septation protein DedD